MRLTRASLGCGCSLLSDALPSTLILPPLPLREGNALGVLQAAPATPWAQRLGRWLAPIWLYGLGLGLVVGFHTDHRGGQGAAGLWVPGQGEGSQGQAARVLPRRR